MDKQVGVPARMDSTVPTRIFRKKHAKRLLEIAADIVSFVDGFNRSEETNKAYDLLMKRIKEL